MIARLLSVIVCTLLVNSTAFACSSLKECFSACFYGYPEVDSPTFRQHGGGTYYRSFSPSGYPAAQIAAAKAADNSQNNVTMIGTARAATIAAQSTHAKPTVTPPVKK